MWNLLPRRTHWCLSDDGAAPIYQKPADRALRVRALKSAGPALEITEHADHVLFEVAGGPGGSPLDAWPVGTVYIAVDNVSPAVKFGGGTWSFLGAGRTLVGYLQGDPDFGTLEGTGGAKTVTLTEQQMPSHTHVQDAHTHTQNSHNHTQNSFAPRIINSGTAGTVGVQGASAASNANASNAATTATNQAATAVNQNATATNQATGGGAAHNNLQPFIVVNFWKRVA